MSDPRQDELWQAVVAHWSDSEAHSAFLEHCRESKRLGEACARYRDESRATEDPERAADAKRRLNGIVARVMAELEATGTPKDHPSQQIGLVVARWSAALICLVALAFFLMKLLER